MIGRLRYLITFDIIERWAFYAVVTFAIVTGIMVVGSQFIHAFRGW